MSDGLGAGNGVVSAQDHRLALAALIAPQTSTLGVRTGVLAAPGVTSLVTGSSATSPMAYSVAAHHWVTSRASSDGVYIGALEAATTVTTTAAPGSNSRIDIIWAKQQDTVASTSVSPDASAGPLYGVTQGTSAAVPTAPTIPVGAVEIGRATVAAGATSTSGAGVTISNSAQLTTLRGGMVPVPNKAARTALTTFPSARALELDLQNALYYDGVRWRYEGDHAIVSNTTQRDALDAYSGLRVTVTADGSEHVRDGSSWVIYDTRWQTYTPTLSVALSAPFSEIIYGNTIREGRYYRSGRRVDLDVYMQVGTTTNYPSNGALRFGYPTGLTPPNSNYAGNKNRPNGQVYALSAGGGLGQVLHEYQATSSDRRMILTDHNQVLYSGGATPVVIGSAVGQWVHFTASYEIA